ncbi:MAG: hypothetical protein AB9873_12005 [Syntrophobacteraceae bacterium]
MRPLLLLIATASALTGTGLICCPASTRSLFRRTLTDTDIRALSSLPLCLGGVLLLSGIIDPGLFSLYVLLGSIVLLKGIYLLCAPPDQVRSVMSWWQEGASSLTLNLYGVLLIVIAGYVGCSALFHR